VISPQCSLSADAFFAADIAGRFVWWVADFPLLLWCFGKFDHAILVWLVLIVFSFLAPVLQMAIVNKYMPTRYLNSRHSASIAVVEVFL
jgi:hypothetical protein